MGSIWISVILRLLSLRRSLTRSGLRSGICMLMALACSRRLWVLRLCPLLRVLCLKNSLRHLLPLIDDWLVLASTFQEIVRARDFLLWLCQRLEISGNLPKSSLDPSQTKDYLGMTIQTSPLRVFPTLKRIQKLSLLLQTFLSTHVHPVSVWRQLLGVMSSLSALVPGVRLRMRSLQLRLNVSGRLQSEDSLVEWDSDCRPDLLWWSDVSHLQVGMSLGEDLPDLSLFTDESDTGWGASLGEDHLSGSWSPRPPGFPSITESSWRFFSLSGDSFLLSVVGWWQCSPTTPQPWCISRNRVALVPPCSTQWSSQCSACARPLRFNSCPSSFQAG